MKKKADNMIDQEISKEEAARDFASFIFNKIKSIDEDYPEDKHNKMVDELVSVILEEKEFKYDKPKEPNLSSLIDFSNELEKIIEMSEKLEEAFPGADELLYNTVFKGESEEGDSVELKKGEKFVGFDDEMEVEFHPDYMHYHRREDGSIEMHSGDEYIEKRENLNYQINKVSKKKNKNSFFETLHGCKGRAIKIALVTKIVFCVYDHTKGKVRAKLDKFIKQFIKEKNRGVPGAKSKAIKRIRKSGPDVAGSALGLLPKAYDFLYGRTVVSAVVGIYLFYKYSAIYNFIDLVTNLSFPSVAMLATDLGVAVALSVFGGSLAAIPRYIYKLQKYTRLINKSCSKLKEIDDFIREKGIAQKLIGSGSYDNCLQDAARKIQISESHAKKIMIKANYNPNIIKVSLYNLMKFFEKNNFSEKNDLKLLISKVK